MVSVKQQGGTTRQKDKGKGVSLFSLSLLSLSSHPLFSLSLLPSLFSLLSSLPSPFSLLPSLFSLLTLCSPFSLLTGWPRPRALPVSRV